MGKHIVNGKCVACIHFIICEEIKSGIAAQRHYAKYSARGAQRLLAAATMEVSLSGGTHVFTRFT